MIKFREISTRNFWLDKWDNFVDFYTLCCCHSSHHFLISSLLFFKKKFVVVYLPIRHLFLGGNFFDADVQNCPIFKALKLLLKSNKNRRAKKKNCKTWKLQPLIWVALKRNKRNCNVAFPLPSCGKDRRNLLKISSKIFDIFSKIKSLDSKSILTTPEHTLGQKRFSEELKE